MLLKNQKEEAICFFFFLRGVEGAPLRGASFVQFLTDRILQMLTKCERGGIVWISKAFPPAKIYTFRSIIMNTENQQTSPEKETNTNHVQTPSPKDVMMADGKISLWEGILIARYFLPLITTIGFILSLIFDPKAGSFLDNLSMICAFIGWISALTVSPLKILKFIFGSVATCFKICRGFIPVYGVADLVAGVVGLGLGLTFSLVVLAVIPAAFTIPKYFKN